VLTLKCWGIRSKEDDDLHGRWRVGGLQDADPSAEFERIEGREEFVSRALRNKSLWLTLAYVGAILLMARAYA
jgi:hypothetical protein